MATAFDDRIVKVGLIIDGQQYFFEGLDIRARGRKFLTAEMNQCTVQISNLTREQRNWLLTEASPLVIKSTDAAPGNRERRPVRLSLDVGRKSYGTFRLFIGDCWASDATQPPDIGVTISSLTGNLSAAFTGGWAQSGPRRLSVICQQIAEALDKVLDFQVTNDKLIDNYSWSGSAWYQLEKLNMMGNVRAAVDNDKLLVLDADKAKAGAVRVINMKTGMVGIPSVTQNGVIVRMLVDNSIEIGGEVKIESEINPAANGLFRVDQINFDIANRANPFFYTLICSNRNFGQGTY